MSSAGQVPGGIDSTEGQVQSDGYQGRAGRRVAEGKI